LWLAAVIAGRLALQGALLAGTRAAGIRLGGTLNATSLLLSDGATLVATLMATLLLSRMERRRWEEYGIPMRRPFSAQMWGGFVFGFAAVALLIGMIAALGGYSMGSQALHGTDLARYALLWLAASLTIGFAEELFFRAYPQFTLATWIGYWPAAVVISTLFGALHFFTKPNERWPDWACTSAIAMLFCLMLRRNGNLKFAIGMHAGFDFAAIFFFSGQNGGQYAVGRLFNATFHGPDWLTGGRLGPEASYLVFPVIALMFVVFDRMYPRAKFMTGDSSPMSH